MGKWLGLPLLASEHGAKIDQLIVIIHVLMVVIFVGWGLFFGYTLLRFRRKKNPVANHDGVKSHASSWLEAAIVSNVDNDGAEIRAGITTDDIGGQRDIVGIVACELEQVAQRGVFRLKFPEVNVFGDELVVFSFKPPVFLA